MSTTTDNELSYFAGFFDGEGCVAIYPKRYVVSLTNTDIRPLSRAKEIWGGEVYCQKKEGRKGALQDLWRWQIYGHSSKEFLRSIRPFTKIKNDQIDIYLEVMNHVPTYQGQKRALGAASIIDAAAFRLKRLKKGFL